LLNIPHWPALVGGFLTQQLNEKLPVVGSILLEKVNPRLAEADAPPVTVEKSKHAPPSLLVGTDPYIYAVFDRPLTSYQVVPDPGQLRLL
jgi:hypothetical protein